MVDLKLVEGFEMSDAAREAFSVEDFDKAISHLREMRDHAIEDRIELPEELNDVIESQSLSADFRYLDAELCMVIPIRGEPQMAQVMLLSEREED